jgi:hypothetical protein
MPQVFSSSSGRSADYQYEPLPGENLIRLLQMIKNDEEVPQITLRVFDLSKRPTCNALSYTWEVLP